MNNQQAMMSRDANGLVDRAAELRDKAEKEREEENRFANSFEAANNGMMIRRDTAQVQQVAQARREAAGAQESDTDTDTEAGEKQINTADGTNAGMNGGTAQAGAAAASESEQSKTRDKIAKIANMAQAQAAGQAGQQASKKAGEGPVPAPAQKPAGAPAANTADIRIRTAENPDALAKAYADMFKSHFDMDLSLAICFENMRKFCEFDTKDPLRSLYLIENTYRISTLSYLASNLPVMVIATILAEKNRKNVQNYIITEVENGAKPYDKLRELRMQRYARKYSSIGVNDAACVTPGVTEISKEMASAMLARFDDTCMKMKKYDRDLAKAVSKLDDSAHNDVVFIYSNCWYFLQGFENVPEMRSYVMAITDDTRRNLKI